MLSRPDDKSAPKAYYKNGGVHGPGESAAHINPSAPYAEPELHPDDVPTSAMRKNKISRIPPRRLAFCGGGVRCVAHVGVMKAMRDANLLSCVKEMMGISAGSFFALLFVLGYTIDQIERLALDFDFTVLGVVDPEDILMFHLNFGLNSGDGIDKLISSVLRQKGFSADVTFAELAKRAEMDFRCFATELQKSAVKEMSAATTPNMSVRVAVRASMSLPIMYAPVKDGDSLLVDGGLLHNLPLVFLSEEEIRESWGVLFITGQREVAPVEGVIDVFKFIYDGLVIMRNLPCIARFKEQLIVIKTDEYNTFNFEETRESRAQLIHDARVQTEAFIFDRGPSVKGCTTSRPRRFSCA
jgi:predicted acylesterase/phospholipase RssA